MSIGKVMSYSSAMESIFAREALAHIEISSFAHIQPSLRKQIHESYKTKAEKATRKQGLAKFGDVIESLKKRGIGG